MYENVEPTQPDAGFVLDLIVKSLEDSSMGVNERFPDRTTVILVLAGRFPAHVVSLRQNACACIDLVAERVYSRRRPWAGTSSISSDR
jgi:hypothetical protein